MDEKQIPQWLTWARKIDSLAQAGLAYSENEYDLDRYRQLKAVVAEIVAEHTTLQKQQVLDEFELAIGYATPKVDVRAAVVQDGKLLMVRERIDNGWTLPGGWVDVGDRPAEAAERETVEESGYQVKAVRLVGVYDTNRGENLAFSHAFKLVFLCELNGGEAAISNETSEVGWFGQHEIPQPFSNSRTSQRHIDDIFSAINDPNIPTVFE